MTKSRHSATKLRLSRLVRILAVLCCLKVAALGLAFFDVPLPHWLGGGSSPREAAEHDPRSQGGAPDAEETSRRLEAALLAQQGSQPAAPAAPAAPEAPTAAPLPEVAQAAAPALAGLDETQPQGSAAAELAAAARPRPHAGAGVNGLPAPVIAGSFSGAGFAAPNVTETALNGPELPTPPPLGSPLVPAGIPAPQAAAPQADDGEGASLWNLLGLTSLPIPGLGSAREAHAAALDMPVPATPPSTRGASSFAPAEQLAPMGGGSPTSLGGPTALPGAAPIPANIPRGQGADGAPLPPRAGELPSRGMGNAAMPALPQTDPSATWPAPAPQVTPKAAPVDPNAQAQDLARQQQDILMLRQQMDQRLKDLQSAEGKMKDMIREAKELEDKKVKNLILMYGNMKPRMAAQALENMDERVAVRILSGMAPKQSGEILTYTNPAKTAKFTEMITRMRMPE
ncbi:MULTISPECIES: hypothetical protein [unclassified Desulfovibrio]|uniref:MotE family protein n=1 Tax=unclassified Desulfovibrio TaxID=2593640 RepID=UPI0013EDDB97|nr:MULTISPECIES: hypothetical protein [unclassified Desulfovibrio]